MTPRAAGVGLFGLLVFLSVSVPVGAAVEPAKSYPLNFTKSRNLRVVYEAGLKPWAARADEMRALKVSDVTVRIILRGAQPFEFTTQIGNFSVLAGNELSAADFLSPVMTVPAAKETTRRVCAALGLPVKGLEEAVVRFETDGVRSEGPLYWRVRGLRGTARVQVALRPLFERKGVKARVYVFLDFYTPSQPMNFLTQPIRPPRGYEHIGIGGPPDGLYDLDTVR